MDFTIQLEEVLQEISFYSEMENYEFLISEYFFFTLTI